MTKIILLIASIFLGITAAIIGWMFLASVCALIVLTICILYVLAFLRAAKDADMVMCDETESFWHEEVNNN